MWVRQNPRFDKRQKPGAPAGTLEDDKDVYEDGGTVTFNVNNMEVKCQASRGDREAPKSASGRAGFVQEYKWETFGTNSPATPYFQVDYTQGTECNASPFADPAITDPDQKPGLAQGDGPSGSARNDNLGTLHLAREVKTSDGVVSVTAEERAIGLRGVRAVSNAAAQATSIASVPSTPIPREDQPTPPPQQPTYHNKGCFAEGRGYWKFSAARPWSPPSP